MVKYEILEHPSELRIKVYGKTLKELFSNAVLAMSEISNSDPNIRIHPNDPNVKKEAIKIKSININSLLVDFLSEVLAKSQINKAVYLVENEKITIRCHPEPQAKDLISKRRDKREILHSVQNDREKCLLEANVIGYPVDHFDEDIKAVTYEDLDIKKVDNYWETMVVFDI